MRALALVLAGGVLAVAAPAYAAPAHAAPAAGEPILLAESTRPCDPDGSTKADAEIAKQLNTTLTGPMAGAMTAYRVSCARVVAAAVRARGLSRRAAEIAITTTIPESTIRNLSYGDRDSLGLYQQRPSQGWGEPEQILDPVFATGSFLDKMVRVDGSSWETAPIGQICQDVQVSAFPQRYYDATADGIKIAAAVWTPPATPVVKHYEPVAVYEEDSTLTQVFGRGTAGELINSYRQTNGVWSAWQAIGTWKIAGNPAPVYSPATSNTEVFARGNDGRLIHTWQTATGWAAWAAIGEWHITSDPVAVYLPNRGVTEVFARGSGDELVHTWRNPDGTWAAWDVIGAWDIDGRPAAVYQPNLGVVEVFAKGNDDRLIHTWRNPDGTWAAWDAIGEWQLTGDPAAVYQPNRDTTEVFGRGLQATVVHTWRNPNGAWGAWDELGAWKLS